MRKGELKNHPSKNLRIGIHTGKSGVNGVTDNQKLVVATLSPPTLKAPWAVLI